jgi:hypothetical protein
LADEQSTSEGKARGGFGASRRGGTSSISRRGPVLVPYKGGIILGGKDMIISLVILHHFLAGTNKFFARLLEL